MYYRPIRRRPKYVYSRASPAPRKAVCKRDRGLLGVLIIVIFSCLFLCCAAFFLKDLSAQIAVSDASDIVTARINNTISDIMREGDYGGDYFVSFEKTATGELTAINSNMARINALSAEILDRVVGVTENHTLTVEIPVGNLTGMSLLMGRGPKVPVKIIVLTSSRVEFNNSVVTAGINQTKHQINLEVIVDIDVLIPWGTESTQVVTEVLIADTVIVGKVPDTFLNME